jgi:hypothetical protein
VGGGALGDLDPVGGAGSQPLSGPGDPLCAVLNRLRGGAISTDLRRWERLGPVGFAFDPALGTDLNLYPNKDALLFPEPVPGPDGEPAFALLHRPMWDLSWANPAEGQVPPLRLPGGWLILHHGAAGALSPGWSPTTLVNATAWSPTWSSPPPSTRATPPPPTSTTAWQTPASAPSA